MPADDGEHAMRVEELVRIAVDDHTREAAPPVHVEALVRRGRRRRAVVPGAAMLATAAVVAGGLYVSELVMDESDPVRRETAVVRSPEMRVGPAPVPGPTEVYVSADGRLHLGDVVTEATPHVDVRLTSNGAAYRDERGIPHFLTTDGEDMILTSDNGPSGALLADSSRPLVAWTEANDEGGADAVLYDTRAGREVARKSFECPPSEWCPELSGLSDGLVFVYGLFGQDGWDPLGLTASRKEYFSIGHDQVAEVHAQTVLDPSNRGQDRYPGLPSGWTVTPPIQGRSLQLSYDGRWVLAPDATIVSVDDPDEQFELEPPGTLIEVAWDFDGSVLAVTKDDRGFQVVDCRPGDDCAPVSPVEDERMLLVRERFCTMSFGPLQCDSGGGLSRNPPS